MSAPEEGDQNMAVVDAGDPSADPRITPPSASDEVDRKMSTGDAEDLDAFAGDSPPKGNADGISRLKRTACVLCRKRKLKCDAARPKCSTCHRLGHACEYNEVRKKSGPKRGYVKALEARLASVETQLKSSNTSTDSNKAVPNGSSHASVNLPNMKNRYQPATNTNPQIFPNNQSTDPVTEFAPPDFRVSPEAPPSGPQDESWELIALGLEEPLPPIDAMNELYEIYFSKVHPSQPMMHKGRFLASLNLAPQFRPPVALRYAMWTLAAGLSEQYTNMQDHFYHRARKYAQQDEMRGFGEAIVSLHYTQAWILICIYEFKNMHFPRAWLSTGRAVRLAQMQGLHRLDGAGLEVKQCLPPSKDWVDKEERRRTFWMAFWEDRCASIGTGWPMTIDEADILTNLPSSEDAFASGQSEQTPSLNEVITGQNNSFSNFAGAVVLTALFGRNLLHLHRPSTNDREEDLNGGFWERHRAIDAILLNINLNLPDEQRIPRGLPDPNVIYLNMCIHTSVICLHQAAIFKIDKNSLPASIGHESKIRCVTAAAEIASIMRSVSHCDLGCLNPFTAFCLYVASRVFVQYLKSRRNDQNIQGSLNFLLSAMNAMKRKNPLSESFLAQLEVDLEAAGIPSNVASAQESLTKKGIYPFKHAHKDDDHKCGPAGIANPAGLEPSTTIPMNMQPNIGSSGSSEVTLPYNQNGQSQFNTYHIPDTSLGIIGSGSNNSRNPSVAGEEMDCSPGHSGNGSTPSLFTQRSGSTGGTSFSPSHNGDVASNGIDQFKQQSQDSQQFSQQDLRQNSPTNNSDPTLIDIPELGYYSAFSDYQMFTDAPIFTPKLSNSAPTPMTQQDFDNFTRQFFPTTSSMGMANQTADAFSGPTGMTPGFGGEDINQILEGMINWENTNPRPGQAWATGRGA